MITYIGSEWGGWSLDIDLVPENSIVLSFGLGIDISFDAQLISEKKCYVKGYDPAKLSTQKSITKELKQNKDFDKHFSYYGFALSSTEQQVSWFGNSIDKKYHKNLTEQYKVETITIDKLKTIYDFDNVSVIKMDIEGSEYDIIQNLNELTVPQLCIEFHDFCSDHTPEETKECINKIKSLGYYLVHDENPYRGKKYNELLFIRKDLAELHNYKDII